MHKNDVKKIKPTIRTDSVVVFEIKYDVKRISK